MLGVSVPPVIAGRYRPVRIIGRGGMGVVYEVEHVHTGQRFALKALSERRDKLVERLKREARALALVQSEHVVRVTDADIAPELGGAPFLVMELLDGVDLERFTGDAPAPPGEVLGWLRQVARGLDKAHAAGVVHRDLKPENLFLTRRDDGTPLVKILDFGVSKLLTEDSSITQSNEFLGSPIYMAPEQTESHGGVVTFRTDLFALGLIAYRLLSGRIYWTRGTLSQVFAQLLFGPMVPPSQRDARFTSAFDAWFLRACDRSPQARFGAAHEQIEALATALGLSASPAATPEPAIVRSRKLSRRRLFVAAGVLAAAATTLLIAGSSRSPNRVGHPRADAPAVRALVPLDPPSPSLPPAYATARPLPPAPISRHRAEATAKTGAQGRPDVPQRRDPLEGQF
jgi:eukaryotic-like serine/threonine-protein kinase